MSARKRQRQRWAAWGRRGKEPATRRLVLESLESRRVPAVFTVDTLADEFDGDLSAGDFSLREAVDAANNNITFETDVVDFAPGLEGTVDLTGGILSIRGGLAIQGPGAYRLGIDAAERSGIFSIHPGVNVTIQGLTLGRGTTAYSGGAISNAGNLTVRDCYFVYNRAGEDGGAIFNSDGSQLTLVGSTLRSNAANLGGAIYSSDSAVHIENSTVSANVSTEFGGGILQNGGTMRITNSTIVLNEAGGSSIASGGGVWALGELYLNNTIVAGNVVGTAPSDIVGAAHSSSSNNLIGDTATRGGLTNGDNGNIVGVNGAGTRDIATVIDAVFDYHGGTMPMHPLVPNSPAIDAGSNTLAVDSSGTPLTRDQRGGMFARVLDGNEDGTATVDIGAYEVRREIEVDTEIDKNDGDLSDGHFSLREAIALADQAPGQDVVHFSPNLLGHTITLSERLVLSTSVTIEGFGADQLTISGVFFTTAEDVRLASLTISGGNTFQGGAIETQGGSLMLDNVHLTGNSAGESGGAVYTLGTRLVVINSTISGNTTTAAGGGILHNFGEFSTVDDPDLLVINSTISGNQGATGGGLFVNSGNARLVNATVVKNVTVNDGAGNAAGGGVRIEPGGSTLTLHNTIVLGNFNAAGAVAPSDLFGDVRVNASRNNLIGDAATAGGLTHGTGGNIVGNAGSGIIDFDTVLQPRPALNGGTTPTFALRAGSPAIDAGNNGLFIVPGFIIEGDQRNSPRRRDGDGDGSGIVDIGAFEVARPAINNFGADLTWTEGGTPVLITSTATVVDIDSPNFQGGRLTVRFSAGGRAEDRLVIRRRGNIDVTATEVLFQGVSMGTFTGGVGATPLVVSLNARANMPAVRELLRNIVYRNVSQNPVAAPRRVWVQLNDGDGGVSTPVTKLINVVSVNDAPQLGGIGGNVGYTQNGAAIALAGAATVTDPDSANFDGGRLLVRFTSGHHASNRLAIGGPFTLAGDDIQLNGTTVATRNANGGVGTTRLEITLNANATRAIVQQLVRAIRFHTVNGTSTTQRVVEFSLTDGDGGVSNRATKMVNVVAS